MQTHVCYIGSAEKVDGIKTGWAAIMCQLNHTHHQRVTFATQHRHPHPAVQRLLEAAGVRIVHYGGEAVPAEVPVGVVRAGVSHTHGPYTSHVATSPFEVGVGAFEVAPHGFTVRGWCEMRGAQGVPNRNMNWH